MDFKIVTGPPCSGKSTWIAERAGGADVFAREGLDNDPARVARDRAEFVRSHAGRPGACYIEACRMPEIAVGAGDTVTRVPMRADEATCLGRLGASDRGRKAEWREVIRSYFSESGPGTGPFHIDTSPQGDEGPHGPESEDRMPDETTSIEATEAEAPKAAEPQGDETDWKAEARKWEKRAKDSKKDFDRVNKVLEGYEAKSKEDEAKEKTAAEALEAAQAEIARLTAEREREALARGIAKKANVSAEVLVLMRGDTEEEIEANAKLLAESTKPRWPEVKDGGRQKAPGKSKEDILAIKNPTERVREIARNIDAFS